MVSDIKNKQPKTTTPTTTPKTPTPAETKAAEAAARAALEEGAEDIEGLMPEVKAEANDRSGAAAATAAGQLGELIVDDGDVAEALGAFKDLSPGETRAAFEALKASNHFDKLVAESDGENRSRLVDLLIKAGMVGSETGVAGTPGPRGPTPPSPPTLAKNDPALPDNVNKLLREENLARAGAYKQEFSEYRDSYRQAVRDAQSFVALRQLGEITEPVLPTWEPGARKRNDDSEWSAVAARGPDVKTASIVTTRLYELNGLIPPGSDVNVSGSIKATVVGSGGSASADYSVTRSERRDGATASSKGGGVGVVVGPKSGPNIKASASTKESKGFDGTTTVENKAGWNASLGFQQDKPDGTKGRTGVDVGGGPDDATFGYRDMGRGATLTVKKDVTGNVAGGTFVAEDGAGGMTTVDVGATGLKARVQSQGAVVGVELTTERAALTVGADGIEMTGGVDKNGGVIVGGKVTETYGVPGGSTIEVSLGGEATVQLPTREDYVRFVSIVEAGPFESPPELERGVRWEKLSEGAQKAYALYGWSADEWNRNSGDKQKIQSAMIGRR